MKKLWIILGAIAAALVAAYFVIVFVLGSLVTRAVNSFGPKLTQTKVTLTAAHLSPFSGEGTLDDLVVGNPAGWGPGDTIVVKRIHVKVVPASIFGDHVVIDELEIDDPQFLYETRFVTSNLGQLVKNIEGGQANPATQAKTSSGTTKRFEISHLVIKGGRVTLAIADKPGVVIRLPSVDFHDLGTSQGGVSSSELTTLVAKNLLETVAKSAVQAIGKVTKTGTGAASDLLHHLRDLFGR
ncbi:MAG: hypothetical protein ACREFX_05685 [Opitutaceae bacterium]